jgi:hypothetical protein
VTVPGAHLRGGDVQLARALPWNHFDAAPQRLACPAPALGLVPHAAQDGQQAVHGGRRDRGLDGDALDGVGNVWQGLQRLAGGVGADGLDPVAQVLLPTAQALGAGFDPAVERFVDQVLRSATSRSVDAGAAKRDFERTRVGEGCAWRKCALKAATTADADADLVAVAPLADGHGVSAVWLAAM